MHPGQSVQFYRSEYTPEIEAARPLARRISGNAADIEEVDHADSGPAVGEFADACLSPAGFSKSQGKTFFR